MNKSLFYRISQFFGFLLGAKVFVTALLAFALYVSTYFLFNKFESFRIFIFDYKVHGLILCSLLSILAGGIINQFYDKEKDILTKPFRSRIQNFLKQRYFLYAYIFLNLSSLGIAALLSSRIFLFLLIYQFLMWFYSHKLSKILFLNNITFVALTLYPFFGILIYYRNFSLEIVYSALFLFFTLLILDVLKDTLTKNADKIFNYSTIPNVFGNKVTIVNLVFLIVIDILISMKIIDHNGLNNIWTYYFALGIFVFIFCIYFLVNNLKNSKFLTLNLLRFWLFVGICAMLLNGIFN
ncbi:UbiA family prenyltransferase [Halpernia frigidisoli]|uniref:4-hydroxybenzoate polyprenyltransferase n=1 Tax=Halpernia frigidisoli TaxID=1125876 RepID=A0A1I3DU31_9FLAO|nr:UbiA family prenyltransferase [Halpernia frigidisoli]SFH90153.1 4-hydroxybenzoate polyprenyltransferase [Halpernia frigidisoli]